MSENKRILVVGGVAGGASFAARARRLDEQAEIVMFERGPNVSFSNCGLPYHLSGVIPTTDDLILMDPTVFKNQYNIDARVNTEVVAINREEKTVTVKNVLTNEESKEAYDKLCLSPGANAIVPNSIEGVHGDNVHIVKNVKDLKGLTAQVENDNVEHITVVGGGFIGVEVAENFKLAGKKVTLVEALDQVMSPFDLDMVQILHKELYDKGIELILSDAVEAISKDSVTLASGRKIETGTVVMAIGVHPETTLAKKAELTIGATGGIKVDHNYLTSDKDIYAVGDAIETYHSITKENCRLPLAGPAQRQARAAADHMYGIPHNNKGVIGSSVVQVFDYAAAATGLNEKAAQRAGIPHDSVYIIPGDKVGLMPDANPLHFKLVYEYPTGRILGAQAIGKGAVDKRVDTIATMITMGGTLEDLKELELCYAPPFGTAKDVVNHAALVALNILYGRFKQVKVDQVRDLVENDAFIVDVREVDEFAEGHLINSVNIPLSEIRDRLDEIPKDRPVYVHCRSGQRSYNALLALQGNGYENIHNISGSYLGICNYEYYNDEATSRKKIVTEYNFN